MSESNAKAWCGDPPEYSNVANQPSLLPNSWSSQWGTGTGTNYTPPTEGEIINRKFQELMPMIDGLLREAYQEGFKEGLLAGMEEVEKQLSEILTADVIKEAQNQNSGLLKESVL
jgi:flagellar biosynthesis/type III secretory pathway protein FliH